MIETHGLTKIYGKRVGCQDIGLSVPEGSLFGFLGPNGAGKSTCIKMLVGLLFPTSGEGTVLGRPLGDVRARKKMGYLPEQFAYQKWMTGADLLAFHCALYRVENVTERSREVLRMVGLEGVEKVKVGSFSKGMQQRIGLACALLCDPDLLFLDEPTSALDPIGRREVRDICLELNRQGKTIFLNSHLLSEVEQLCDTVTIINQSRVIKTARMEELLTARHTLYLSVSGLTEQLWQTLRQFDPNAAAYPPEGTMTRLALTLTEHEQVPAVAAAVVQSGVNLYELHVRKDSLEDVFIRLVGGSGEGGVQ